MDVRGLPSAFTWPARNCVPWKTRPKAHQIAAADGVQGKIVLTM
jgi:hypothetical protein